MNVKTNLKAGTDHPDINPGWTCVDDPAEGVICIYDGD
jgi:hypothetical protein